LSLVQLAYIFNSASATKSLQDLIDLIVEGTKTPTNLSHELHRWLKGKEISVGEIPKMDTPLDLFFSGTH